MIALIDYGVGNLFSLQRSFEAIGEQAIVTPDPQKLRDAERLILPGVGAFRDAAEKLHASGLDEVLLAESEKGKPLMGICLGMQMLFDRSFEYGEYRGLGLIPGDVRPISDVIGTSLKIPHIGWNALHFQQNDCPIFKYTNEGDHVYFVHSYYAANCTPAVVATAEYGAELTAAVAKDNVFGCQFHPEKSGEVGLRILKAFCEMGD